jgi:glycosyltransferase involved in cell wall biosynthesis
VKLSVCLLTFNSERLLREVLAPLVALADELVVLDSGSSDGTQAICAGFGLTPRLRPYRTHAEQMNHAVSLAANDWVFCIDSDEILDEATVAAIRALKAGAEPDPATAFRIRRHWHVLGREVHALYPVSSPDYPVRLFNRRRVRFNYAPVDDKPFGFARTEILPGRVRHDTFHTLDEVFQKLNAYTSRLVRYSNVQPSLWRACLSAVLAFLKWYFRKGNWRDGPVGVVAGVYAFLYSFLKYFKAWYLKRSGPGRG